MTDLLYKDLNSRMEKGLQSFESELKAVRTGRASPNLLDPINVEVYGSMMPINQAATVNVQEGRMLTVQVWDKSMVKKIEKAINDSDLGVNASSDGQLIRVPLPPLSEERRKDLTKIISKYAEQARVVIRNIRRDGMEKLKKLEKDNEISQDDMHKKGDEIQKLTDQYITKIDNALDKRKQEIMQV